MVGVMTVYCYSVLKYFNGLHRLALPRAITAPAEAKRHSIIGEREIRELHDYFLEFRDRRRITGVTRTIIIDGKRAFQYT